MDDVSNLCQRIQLTIEDTTPKVFPRLREEMTQEERQFIVSVKEGKTQWDLLGVPGIENLPAVRWKLQNIRRMAPRKHQEALRKLRDYLGV